jgi:hypothetical protein
MRRQTVALVAALAAALAAGSYARAQTYQEVDFSSQANFSWSASTDIPAAPSGPTPLGGIPFDITSNLADNDQEWSARVARCGSTNGNLDPGGQVSIAINTDIYGASTAYTLINTFNGQVGQGAWITFTGTGGASYTKPLAADSDIRDYNIPSIWADQINGTTTVNVFSSVDEWGNTGVLDMQKIALPSSFANQTLTQIALYDNGGPDQRMVLTGVTVASSVPEPSTAVLLGVCAATLFAAAWRRHKRS